jgi:hypothetical protein
MYESYKEVCVHHSGHVSPSSNLYNGTFFSRNLYVLAFNYASGLGKRRVVNQLNKYNTLGADTCYENSKSAQKYMSQITSNIGDLLRSNKV